ncbi:hypothetical protein BASA81_002111 [Batrachochytrium salamandrivorans]|nr:hypothetical protein BASA81_002111 [Batrachochytrium salamandrivorans]
MNRASAWLSQAEDSLTLDDFKFSTPKAKPPPPPLRAVGAPSPPLPSSLNDEDPFDANWKSFSPTPPPPSSSSSSVFSARKRHPTPLRTNDSAQKKAERFLATTSSLVSNRNNSLRFGENEEEEDEGGDFGNVISSSSSPVLLRCSLTGKFLEPQVAIIGTKGFVLEECEVVLERPILHVAGPLRFGEMVYLRFKSQGKFVGDKCQAVMGKEKAVVWFIRGQNQGKLVRGNCTVQFEHSMNGTLLSLDGDDGDKCTEWNLVRFNGLATCYLPPPSSPLPSSATVAAVGNGEVNSLLDMFLQDNRPPEGLEPEMYVLFQHVSQLKRFAANRRQQSGRGLVAAALGQYLEERVLDPFQEFVSTLYLEQEATLTLVMNRIQPACRLVVDWFRLCKTLKHLGGGALLNALFEAKQWAFEHPRHGQAALDASLEPYLAMLQLWLTKGKLKDPFGEFLVSMDASRMNSELASEVNSRYWSRRFVLTSDVNQIPWFLQPVADQVLKIGRNWDAMPPNQSLLLSRNVTGAEIERLFSQANTHVLDELRVKHALPQLLRCFKRFFLLEQGDFFSHFLDVAQGELATPTRQDGGRLQVLLPVLLRETAAQSSELDPFLDCFSCKLVSEAIDVHVDRIQNSLSDSNHHSSSTESDMEQLLCVDVFAMDFSPRFPVSLVLTRRSITKYQLLFRHLFRCKHAERVLGRVWQTLRHETMSPGTSLVQRMTQFLQSFAYYVAFEVIEPRWQVLWPQVLSATNIDSLLQAHEDFLDSCLKECLLTNPRLIRQFSKLLRLCLDFANTSLATTNTRVD